jgi:hypothetical protein
MNKTLATKIALPAAVLALGLVGAAPVAAQTTTIPSELATLTVTKTVFGTPPAGTTFVLHLTCVSSPLNAGNVSKSAQLADYDEDMTFGAAGGSKNFTFNRESTCDVTETDDGGATSSSGPVHVVINNPTQFNATITNTFVEATTTAPPAAWAAVEAKPAFTG